MQRQDKKQGPDNKRRSKAFHALILTLFYQFCKRLIKNNFYEEILKAKQNHATVEVLRELLGKGRAKRGMFEGDLEEGELEIGQVSALIRDIKPAAEIVKEIWLQFREALGNPLK